MDQELSGFRVSEWALVIDLMGTSDMMADRHVGQWGQPLLRILDAIFSTATLVLGDRGKATYQFGDAICICGDDPVKLLDLSVTLQRKLLGNGTLAQMALASGGVYDLTKLEALENLRSKPFRLNLMCVVGPALATAFVLLRGLGTARIVIDAESNMNVAELRSAIRIKSTKPTDDKRGRLEVYWWDSFPLFNSLLSRHSEEANRLVDAFNVNHNPTDVINERRLNNAKRRADRLATFTAHVAGLGN